VVSLLRLAAWLGTFPLAVFSAKGGAELGALVGLAPEFGSLFAGLAGWFAGFLLIDLIEQRVLASPGQEQARCRWDR
jgi:uncharacterized membrane protein